MATDIMGLLTGVSKQGISPLSKQGVNPMLSQLTPAQQRMEFGRQSAQGLQRAVRGMLGGGAPIQEQIQAGLINKQLKEQQVLANTDIGDVESLKDAVKVLQSQGKRTEALAYIRRIEELEKQESLKQTLLRLAKAQGNQQVMDMINDGSDLDIAYRLLTQSSGAPAVLSEKEQETYYTILQQLVDKVSEDSLDGKTRFLPKLITDEKLIGSGRKLKSIKDLTSFFQNVKEFRRLNPNTDLEAIMLELSGLGGATIDMPQKSTASPESNTYDSQDKFRGLQGSGGGLKPTGKKGRI